MRVGLARLAALPPATQLALATGTVAPGTPVDPIVHELLHHAAANSTVNIIMQYRWLRLLRALLSIATMVLVSVACALYPAWRATRISPTEALHYE